MSIPDEVMKKLKKKVFNQQNKYLVETLGDPSRYFPYMVSADILNFSDKEHIRSKITSKEKAETFIDILMQREEASAFDEFVEALLEERVQSHIARRLQQALKVEIDKLNIPPAAQTNATDEELISSVASISLTDSYHSVNEEVTPCIEPVIDGPKPPPPPSESLIKTSADLLPPMPPTREVNLSSYNTHSSDDLYMQEASYTSLSELDSLKKENEELKTENSKLKAIVQRLRDENMKLLNQNTTLQYQAKDHANQYQNGERPMKVDSHNWMPIPEQSAEATRQSEMVPKGSGTY